MIKALIIDSVSSHRNSLQTKIKKHFSEEISIVAHTCSIKAGLNAIKKHSPNLLFLDTSLKDGTGFDLIEKSPTSEYDVIFISKVERYARKAFKFKAVDYILKPFDDDELKSAVKRVIHQNTTRSLLKRLLSTPYNTNGIVEKRVILKTSDTVYAVYENDILYCQSESNYTHVFTRQGRNLLISKTLKEVQTLLSDTEFIRCHQSYLVNKKHVFEYDKQGMLVVEEEHKIPVSSRRKEYTLKYIFDI